MSIDSQSFVSEHVVPQGTEMLFSHCFEMRSIPDDYALPIGGDLLSNELNINAIVDTKELEPFFESTQSLEKNFNKPKLKEWLASMNIQFDEQLYSHLVSFTKKFEKYYPVSDQRHIERQALYNQSRGETKLSEVLDKGAAECAEIAALAQVYLQKNNISSSYFSGDLLRVREHEFSEPHSFIILHTENTTYIFDPANPTPTTQGVFPSVFRIACNFDEEMRKGVKRLATGVNILSGESMYFGVHNHTDVRSEDFVA